MTKTIKLDEVQTAAMLFLLGGRHNTQLEPHQKAALDDVETHLRGVQLDPEPVVAPAAKVATRKKASRGRK